MDMDISIDIHAKSADMDGKFHMQVNPFKNRTQNWLLNSGPHFIATEIRDLQIHPNEPPDYHAWRNAGSLQNWFWVCSYYNKAQNHTVIFSQCVIAKRTEMYKHVTKQFTV